MFANAHPYLLERELIHYLNLGILQVDAPARDVSLALRHYAIHFYDDCLRLAPVEEGCPIAMQIFPQIELVRSVVRDLELLDELCRIWGIVEALATEPRP